MTQSIRRLALALALAATGSIGPMFGAAIPLSDDPKAPLLIFREDGSSVLLGRCATLERQERMDLFGFAAAPLTAAADCAVSSTNPVADYDAGAAGDLGRSYLIDVYVHVITNSSGTQGNVSDADIYEQIGVLNQDFRAIPGSLGADGRDMRLFFRIAPETVEYGPGITRSANTTWFNDGGVYYNSLARRPATAINIYTNSAGGNLGYVPWLPQDSGGTLVGTSGDRVVIYWESIGLTSFTPYHLGRTTTHELGHYFGLEHTFTGGCIGSPAPPSCYSNGDLICDTNAEQSPFFGGPPCSQTTCSTPDPTDNYMDYSEDACMDEFTLEQSRRIRCSQYWWRPGLLGQPVIFYDGFETSLTDAWSSATP